MMKKLLALILPVLIACSCGHRYDVCVYGGSASGCIAAIQAARMGKDVILISPLAHVGGMVTSGLTATDMNKHQCIGGVTAEFYGRIYEYYTDSTVWRNQTRDEFMVSTKKRTYKGKNDERRIQWVYESGVAEKIMLDMLEEGPVRKCETNLNLVPALPSLHRPSIKKAQKSRPLP